MMPFFQFLTGLVQLMSFTGPGDYWARYVREGGGGSQYLFFTTSCELLLH